MTATSISPVHLDADLDPQLSRWLWLVKWALAIPHYLVLACLWVAFVVTSLIAMIAIVFTGRYPPAIFTFNEGVLRWNWRVAYYSYSALGTDRYPPFTLHDVPEYPAHLSIDYPEHLSRGLVLVKWWLLAIPQYLVVAILAGGGSWAATRSGDTTGWAPLSVGGGLIGLLVLVAAVTLAVTGTYPTPLFDMILGLNRWTVRVSAYAGLMTDTYPPFRLDQGGHDPAVVTLEAPPTGPAGEPSPTGGPGNTDSPIAQAPVGNGRTTPASHRAWPAGRILSLVAGSLLGVSALGLLLGGVTLAAADHVQRDTSGYLTSSPVSLSSAGSAITTDALVLEDAGTPDLAVTQLVGTIRVRVTSSAPARPVFVGIARTSEVSTYLAGTSYSTVRALDNSGTSYTTHSGAAVPAAPTGQAFWATSASGPGTQTLTWTPSSGDWVLVVMNTDTSPGVAVTGDAAATVPGLSRLAWGLAITGLLLLAAGVLLVAVPLVRASRDHHARPAPTAAH